MMPKIDKIIKSNRKTISLQLIPTGELIVKAPYTVTKKFLYEFILRKQNWILDKQKLIKQAVQLKKQAQEKDTITYLGDEHPVIKVDNLKEIIKFDKQFLIDTNSHPHIKTILSHWYAQQAEKTITMLVTIYTKKYNLKYRNITIGSAVKRFGSCRNDGSLRFSRRIMLMPLKIVEYIVVHELSHLVHMNHSNKFWQQVGIMMPEYKLHEKWLKDRRYHLILDHI